MRSSISNSKSTPWVYAKVLCMICVIFLIAFEVLSAYLLEHHSETYRRVSEQFVWAAGAISYWRTGAHFGTCTASCERNARFHDPSF